LNLRKPSIGGIGRMASIRMKASNRCDHPRAILLDGAEYQLTQQENSGFN
jgi:hypothetical protein